jgi:hypothetical protein
VQRASARPSSVWSVLTFPEIECRLREQLDLFPRAARAEMFRILRLPDFDRAAVIGSYWMNPKTRTFAEAPDRRRGGPADASAARRDARGARPLVNAGALGIRLRNVLRGSRRWRAVCLRGRRRSFT